MSQYSIQDVRTAENDVRAECPQMCRPHHQYLPTSPPSHRQGQGKDQGRVWGKGWCQHRQRLHLCGSSQLGRIQRVVRPRHPDGTLQKAFRHASAGGSGRQALPWKGEQKVYQGMPRRLLQPSAWPATERRKR